MTTVAGMNHDILSTLVGWEAPVVVSAFAPVDFSRPQPTEPVTKALRRLAQLATNTLTDQYGLGQSAAALFVSPLLNEFILDDVAEASRGLAVFVSVDRAMHVAVPIPVGPAVEVGGRLDVLRLLPVVVDDAKFYALTIGKKRAQLFCGSRFEFETVPVPDMPESIDEALWYVRRESTRNRVGAGVMHGAGGVEDSRKDDVRQYIHLIDKAITPVLNGAADPLVVIGVEYEAAMFINHTHYRHTVHVPVLGNAESMSASELHSRCSHVVGALSRSADEALERFGHLAGTGRTATDPEELIAATSVGSVSELLVARSATVDSESPMSAETRRTVVAAVNECLRHRATIHVVDDDRLPGGVRVAAVLRY